jgi:hypothetical protein
MLVEYASPETRPSEFGPSIADVVVDDLVRPEEEEIRSAVVRLLRLQDCHYDLIGH